MPMLILRLSEAVVEFAISLLIVAAVADIDWLWHFDAFFDILTHSRVLAIGFDPAIVILPGRAYMGQASGVSAGPATVPSVSATYSA